MTKYEVKKGNEGIDPDDDVDLPAMVHLYVDMMNANAPYTVIRDAIYIHPTLAEFKAP